MIDNMYLIVALTVVTGVLVEVLKKAEVETKYLPIISITVGVVLGVVDYNINGTNLMTNLLLGLMIGASASGIYDLGEAVKEINKTKDTIMKIGKKEENEENEEEEDINE